MIHTDIDIKDELYAWIHASELAGMVSGEVYKDQRPLNSNKEDIIIAVIENSARLRTLCTEAAALFEYRHTGDCIISLASQEIFKANGIDWHVINNKLSVRYNNE